MKVYILEQNNELIAVCSTAKKAINVILETSKLANLTQFVIIDYKNYKNIEFNIKDAIKFFKTKGLLQITDNSTNIEYTIEKHNVE